MADEGTLKLIQDDIQSIKSQIDILRMEARAHQLESLSYLLDLAFQEVKKSEISDSDASHHIRRPLTMQ